jgi:hypothetical protein
MNPWNRDWDPDWIDDVEPYAYHDYLRSCEPTRWEILGELLAFIVGIPISLLTHTRCCGPVRRVRVPISGPQTMEDARQERAVLAQRSACMRSGRSDRNWGARTAHRSRSRKRWRA